MMSIKFPLWLRFFLLIGVVVFAAGAGLLAYRYYTRPATLTVAVGSIDGEAAKAGKSHFGVVDQKADHVIRRVGHERIPPKHGQAKGLLGNVGWCARWRRAGVG